MKSFCSVIVVWLFYVSAASPSLAGGSQTRGSSNHAVELVPNARVRLAFVAPRKPFLTDRKYMLRRLPKGTKGASLVVRNSGISNHWLAGKQLVAKKDCTVYASMQIGRNRTVLVPLDYRKRMKSAGWKQVKALQTTGPNKEAWTWATFTKAVPKGPVELPNPLKARTNYIFMFR